MIRASCSWLLRVVTTCHNRLPSVFSYESPTGVTSEQLEALVLEETLGALKWSHHPPSPIRTSSLFILRPATRCLVQLCAVLNVQDQLFKIYQLKKHMVVPNAPHFVTMFGMISTEWRIFSAGPSSQSENTLQTLPWRVLLVGTASMGLVALMLMDWPKKKSSVQTDLRLWNHISTQHFVEGWFGKIPWMMSPEWWHESIPNVPKLL